jgi:putative hydrolase
MRDFFLNNVNKVLSQKKCPKVDLHNHTTWTDGKNTVKEMVETAKKKKIEHIFFSEHTRISSGHWFDNFYDEVKNSSDVNCSAYAGTEVKVLDYDGKLDLSENIEKKSEFIMASVHRFPGEKGDIKKNISKLSPEQAVKIEFELSLAAIENPKTLILGHPFGMSLKRFKTIPENRLFKEIILRCKKFDKVFEINANYHTEINYLVQQCLEFDTLISLGSNAHNITEVGKIINLIKL